MENIGDCYKKIQDYEIAISLWYDKTIEQNPQNIDALKSKGICLNGLKKHCEAELAYKELLKSNKNDPNVLDNLGWTYYCLGNFKKKCIYYSELAIKRQDDANYTMFMLLLQLCAKKNSKNRNHYTQNI